MRLLALLVQVRFADVQRRRAASPAAPASGAAAAAQKAQQKAQQLLGGLRGGGGGGVVVAPPAPRTAATAATVYGVLAAWTLAQGILEPNPSSPAADVPGLQLALATAATVYLLREEKRAGLGKVRSWAVCSLAGARLRPAAACKAMCRGRLPVQLRCCVAPLLGRPWQFGRMANSGRLPPPPSLVPAASKLRCHWPPSLAAGGGACASRPRCGHLPGRCGSVLAAGGHYSAGGECTLLICASLICASS